MCVCVWWVQTAASYLAPTENTRHVGEVKTMTVPSFLRRLNMRSRPVGSLICFVNNSTATRLSENTRFAVKCSEARVGLLLALFKFQEKEKKEPHNKLAYKHSTCYIHLYTS